MGPIRLFPEQALGLNKVTDAAKTCTVAWLGRVEYQRAWDLQRALARARAAGSVGDLLLLLEHPHVYTLGRRGRAEDILLNAVSLEALGVAVHHVDRGGEVTYHGPGQLVGYPIVDLRAWGGGPVTYVRALEQLLIDALRQMGVEARRIAGLTGVWVGEQKVAAIGVHVSRGVTTHGFALNVDPDLSYFQHIVACGLAGREVTSVARVLAHPVAVEEVWRRVAHHFGLVFGFSMIDGDPDTFYRLAGLHVPAHVV